MALCTPRILARLCPSIIFTTWYIAFFVIGAACLAEDQGLSTEKCGQSTHIYKYTLYNTVFALFSLITYYAFPGGGEGTRARAVLCCILHLAFAVWGAMLWSYMSNSCETVLTNQFPAITSFHHMCIAHNVVLWLFLFVHETCLGQRLGYDLTIVPEIRKTDSYASLPTTAHPMHQDTIQSYSQPPPEVPVGNSPAPTGTTEVGQTIGSVDQALGQDGSLSKNDPPELKLNK